MIEAVPMFAERKCILLKDFPVSSLSDDELNMLISCIENMPQSTVLILTYANMQFDKGNKKNVRLLETVKAKGKIAVCDTPNKEELSMWIMRMAKMFDASIEQDNAFYLFERIGTDMRRLRSEMPKIASYAAGEILPAHIDAIAVKQPDAGVYDMVRSISRNNFKEAYSELDELFALGLEAEFILGSIAGAYADLYIAKLAKKSGKTVKDVVLDLGYKQNSDFRVKNAMRDEARYSDRFLTECIKLIDNADKKLKSFSTDPKLVLEELIAAIAAAGAENG